MSLVERRIEFQELVKDLEERLESKDVEVDFFVDISDAIERYVKGLIGNLAGNIMFPGCITKSYEMTNFRKLLRTFKKNRGKAGYNLELVVEPQDSWTNYARVGWVTNPHYDEQMKKYETNMAKYREDIKARHSEREQTQQEIERLKRSPDWKTYQYVKDEEDKAKCSSCYGWGTYPSFEYNGVAYQCSSCNGTGSSGYVPKTNASQKQIAEAIESKLAELNKKMERIIFEPREPYKSLPAFVRV